MTDRSRALHLLWIPFEIHVLRLYVCSLRPSAPAWKALMCCVLLWSVTFPRDVSGRVGCLIVSVSDLCLLYFDTFTICNQHRLQIDLRKRTVIDTPWFVRLYVEIIYEL